MMRSLFSFLAFLSALLCQEAASAETTTTLWCTGHISAENSLGQHRSGEVATTITFDEDLSFFSIKDSGNLEKGAIVPYKELKFLKSSIQWSTGVSPYFGFGTFFGSIDRITGEMTTHYFGTDKSTGVTVTIRGQLVCRKQVGNRF